MNYGMVHALIEKYSHYEICDMITDLDAKIIIVDKIHQKKSNLA